MRRGTGRASTRRAGTRGNLARRASRRGGEGRDTTETAGELLRRTLRRRPDGLGGAVRSVRFRGDPSIPALGTEVTVSYEGRSMIVMVNDRNSSGSDLSHKSPANKLISIARPTLAR